MSVEVEVVSNTVPSLLLRVADFISVELLVGYRGELALVTYESGPTVVENAAVQEFGKGNIPSRPFMRHTLKHQRDAIRVAMEDGLAAVIAGQKDVIDAWLDVASQILGLFIETLDTADSWAVPNAPLTVRRKWHTHPLMGGAPPDDGPERKLRENMTWTLRRYGTVIAEGN